MNGTSSWLDDAARLPLAFAQVREDPNLDLEVLERFRAARVVLVASGGCTAAALAAAAPVSHLHLIDPNPAQLALTRLKLHLLQRAAPAERLALLGHGPLPAEDRQQHLGEALRALDLAPDCLGPAQFVAEVGPDHAGRYERLFVQLRAALRDQAAALTDLFQLADPVEQARRVAPETDLGRVLDRAYDDVLGLPNLVRLFGEGATRNRVEPFARHFARRTRHALATLPAASNPWLWQMLAGTFPPTVVYPWLTAVAPAKLPTVTWEKAFMADALAAAPDPFDVVHLSNILDWLSPEEAHQTLDLSWRALRSGGVVVLRQLNSTLDIPAADARFDWQVGRAAAMHARDRSFFYRGFHLGRKP